jgi:diguanylate cyclase (GGDEF)-like protein
MHRLLERQLKRHLGEEAPSTPPWRNFLEAVDDAYQSADSSREMLERSLVLSSGELHRANAEMRAIFQVIPDLLFRLKLDGTILELKAGSEADLLLTPRNLIGKKIQKIPNRQAASVFQNSLNQLMLNAQMRQIEYGLNVKGKESFFEARLVPFLDDQVVVIIQNITRRKQGEALIQENTLELLRINSQLEEEIERRHAVEERLLYDVSHDRLTGLVNRQFLITRVDQCIELAKRDPDFKFALLFIDIDDFKVVNDSLGHEAGDHLLIGVSLRLAAAIRAVDTAGRLGGDEFVLILVGNTSQRDAVLVAERIKDAMQEPFLIRQREVTVALSIGIALGRHEHEQAADILRDADAAVYRAKHDGKNRTVIFGAETPAEVRQKPIPMEAL